MPYEATRLSVCEHMGWTFKEYDDQSAQDMYVAFELWKLQDAERAHKMPRSLR